MADLNAAQRISMWVVKHIPTVMVTETERVGLSAALFVVGMVSLDRLDDGAFSDGVEASVIIWSVTLMVGAVFNVVGMTLSSRWAERFGLLLLCWGCLIYGVTILGTAVTRAGYLIGVMFLFLAAVKLLRLIISTAAMAATILRGSESGD